MQLLGKKRPRRTARAPAVTGARTAVRTALALRDTLTARALLDPEPKGRRDDPAGPAHRLPE
ncbi:MAG: hypothetical protein RR197_06520, partial [Oscillospiraceae bacterium]